MKRFVALSTLQLRYLGQKLIKKKIQTGASNEIALFIRPIYGVVNIQPAHLPGLHWIAVLLKKKAKVLEIFDSFGFAVNSYGGFISKFAKSRNLKLQYNKMQYQSNNSLLCGYYALFFLNKRLRGTSFNNILKLFTKNLKENDAMIRRAFKNFSFPTINECSQKCFKKCDMRQNDFASVCIQKNKRCFKFYFFTFIFFKILEQVYEDPNHEAGFSNAPKLYKAVKKYHITRKNVDLFLAKQDSYTKHRYAKYKYPRRPMTSPTINFRWQADLMMLDKLYRHNSFYKYILVVIDILSRYAYAFPLKTKTGVEVASVLDKLFSTVHPRFLHVDAGREWFNANVRAVLKKHGVEMYHTYSNVKAACAERLGRTIKEKLNRFMVHNKTKRWVHKLQDVINSYNSTTHSRTKCKPKDVTLDNQMSVWHQSFDKQLQRKRLVKFKAGDYVRILINKKVFDKSTSQNFSNTIYRVDEILNTIPVMYKLRDTDGIVPGSFYNEELSKVEI